MDTLYVYIDIHAFIYIYVCMYRSVTCYKSMCLAIIESVTYRDATHLNTYLDAHNNIVECHLCNRNKLRRSVSYDERTDIVIFKNLA